MLTLYYSQQIQIIDTDVQIKSTNIFNDNIHWLKQIYNVRPEDPREMPVIMVAEYVTAWIIDGLKANSNINVTEPIPPQLWLHVAKKDPTDLRKINKLTDIMGLSAGQQKIPVKINKNEDGTSIQLQLQLRYLIGCVSVIGNDGYLYQYSNSNNNSDSDLKNLNYFGYTYVTPFSSDPKILQAIIEGRKLQLHNCDSLDNIIDTFQDVAQHTQAFVEQTEQAHIKSIITQETAQQIAEVLRQEKTFLDPYQLAEVKEKMELDIKTLEERIEQQANEYQNSINAAHEQIIRESEQNRQAMKTDNEQRCNQAIKQLMDKTDEITNNLQDLIKTRMDQIQKQLQQQIDNIMTTVQTANAQSLEAAETAQQAAQNAEKAVNSAEHLTQWAQKLNEEFQISMEKSEKVTKETAFQQKQMCEEAISDIRTKAEQNIERARETIDISAQQMKDSALNAKESLIIVQNIQKTTNNQLENDKIEIKRMLTEAKEAQQACAKTVVEAQEARKQATQATNMTATMIEKFNLMDTKVKETIEKSQQTCEKSQQAAQNVEKAVKSAERLTQWAQKLNEEFQASMEKCEKVTKQTAFQQQQMCEETISDIRTKAQRNIERAREAVDKSAQQMKDSAIDAKESLITLKNIQKTTNNQLENDKFEIKRMSTEAKEAQKQATQAVIITTTVTEKVNEMLTKVENELRELRHLTQKLST